MKTFQRLLGMLLVLTASAGLIVACGDDAAGDSCIDSNDCAVGERCNLETEQCAFACEDDTGCEGEETCEDIGDGGGVCVLPATGNNGNNGEETCADDSECTVEGEVCDLATNTCVAEGPECTENEQCDQDAGEFCDTAIGECVTADVNYQYARISDLSDLEGEASLCEDASDNDPGSDIYGVELTKTDADGNSESFWARWVNFDNIDTTTHTNDLGDPTGVIEGQPLDFTGTCPDAFDSTTIVSLGCGGSMLVEFVDTDENVQFIEDQDAITVYEWGTQCNSTGPQDQWSVSICEAGSNTTNAECDGEVAVDGGTGLQDVTVQL